MLLLLLPAAACCCLLLLAAAASASRRADVLLSDMAPNMSGNKIIDSGRHYNLVALALEMADDWLRKGGAAAIKVFRGDGFEECRAAMMGMFREVRSISISSGRVSGSINTGFSSSIRFRSRSSSRSPGLR